MKLSRPSICDFDPEGADVEHLTPLVVDLDGTLFRFDTLWEAMAHLIKNRPFFSLQAPAWLAGGKSYFKERVAEASPLDPSNLPINRDLVSFLTKEKAKGRFVVLATGAHRTSALRLVQDLDLFGEVIATEGSLNLTGRRKRDELIRKFGPGGFDYVGNSLADLPVWKACRRIHVSNPGPLVLRRLRQWQIPFRIHGPAASYPRELIRELRVHQWVKNSLVFVPLFSSHRLFPEEIGAALIAFAGFSLCASGAYLLNDLLDLESDRLHPTKRFRPAALGSVPLSHVFLLAPALPAAAIALSFLLLPASFGLLLLGYYAATVAYSFRLKRVPFLDAFILAGLYTARIIGGAFAIGVVPSVWILAFSFCIFTSLAFAKRYAEIMELRKRSGFDSPPASRLPGRGYRLSQAAVLGPLGVGAGIASGVVAGLFIRDENTVRLYPSYLALWLVLPILLFWLGRLWVIARIGSLNADPVLFAVRDKASLVCGAIMGAVFLFAALYGG